MHGRAGGRSRVMMQQVIKPFFEQKKYLFPKRFVIWQKLPKGLIQAGAFLFLSGGGYKMMTEKSKALDLAITSIEKQFGKGSIMKLGGGPFPVRECSCL